jgi:hypothetical protein
MIVIGFIVICIIIGALSGPSTSSKNDSLKAERDAITAEGNGIVADMERANRNNDWSHVREIREHKADWERRNQEWQDKARKDGWR